MRPELLYRPYRVGDRRAARRCSAITRCPIDRLPLPVVGRPARRATTSSAGSATRPAVHRATGGEVAHGLGHPRRRERLGALRRRRPAVPARALRRARRRRRYPDRHDGRGGGRPGAAVAVIFPGSWINADFYIWAGHRDDQRAWAQLRRRGPCSTRARRSCRAAARDRALRGAPDRRRQRLVLVVRRRPFVGPRREFDELFRRHLRNAYEALGAPVPEALFATNITTGAGPDRLAPSGLPDRDPGRPGHLLSGVGGRSVAVAGQARRRDAGNRGPVAHRRSPGRPVARGRCASGSRGRVLFRRSWRARPWR